MGVLCMLVLSVISKVLKVFVASQHVRKKSVHRWRGSEMVKTQDPVRWTHGLMDPESHDVLHQFANEIHV